MLFGWKLFKYERETPFGILSEEMSYCKCKILQYSNKVFQDQGSSRIIEIFATASTTLECIIDDFIEIRLFAWNMNNTISVILEKIEIANLKCIFQDRQIEFTTTKHTFRIIFYKSNCVYQFKEIINGFKQAKIELDTGILINKAKEIGEPISHLNGFQTSFVTEMSALTGKQEFTGEIVEINNDFAYRLTGLLNKKDHQDPKDERG